MTIPQSHRLGPWYGHWHPRSKKGLKKPVCEAVLWLLTLKKPSPRDRGMVTGGPGEKPEHRCLSFIKTSPYWCTTDAGVRIAALRITANTMARTRRERICFFFVIVMSNVRRRQEKKKLNSPPSVLRHRIYGNLEGTNSNASVRCPLIRGSFDGWRTPAFRFLTRSGSDHTSVSRTGFF